MPQRATSMPLSSPNYELEFWISKKISGWHEACTAITYTIFYLEVVMESTKVGFVVFAYEDTDRAANTLRSIASQEIDAPFDTTLILVHDWIHSSGYSWGTDTG